MAWAQAQTAVQGTASSGTSLSVSFGSNTTAGNMIVAVCLAGSGGAGTTMAVSDNDGGGGGNTYRSGSLVNISNLRFGQLFYKENIIGGTATTVKLTSSTHFEMIIMEWSGELTTGDPQDGASTNSGTGSISTGSIAVNSSGELVIGVGAYGGAGSGSGTGAWTESGSFSSIWNDTSYVGGAGEFATDVAYVVTGSAQNYQPTWAGSAGATRWLAFGMSFKIPVSGDTMGWNSQRNVYEEINDELVYG
jgi:hypothetical protein